MTDSLSASIEIPIAAYAAWAPGVSSPAEWDAWAAGELSPRSDGVPELPFVAPLLRRRLSRSARMMLWATHQVVPPGLSLRTVFSSRHGELHRTVPMLRELARQEELSPAEFSLSVHNAAAGVNAIVRADRSASVSIAAGEDSFGYALLEAAIQWRANPDEPVLAVYADEPAPMEYQTYVGAEPVAHAVAFLVSSRASSIVRVERKTPSPADRLSSQESLSFSFLRAWIQQEASGWCGARSQWSWTMIS